MKLEEMEEELRLADSRSSKVLPFRRVERTTPRLIGDSEATVTYGNGKVKHLVLVETEEGKVVYCWMMEDGSLQPVEDWKVGGRDGHLGAIEH